MASGGHTLHSALHHARPARLRALVRRQRDPSVFWNTNSVRYTDALVSFSHLAPRADLPVGRVWAVPEEARPAAWRVRLHAVGGGRGGLRNTQVWSRRGGRRRAGDNTLLETYTAAGGALSRTETQSQSKSSGTHMT